jgi:hypothetical protein
MATPALQAANPLRLPHFRTAEVTIVSLLWLILSGGDLLAATDGVVRHRTIDGRVLSFFGTVDLREAVRHPRERAQFDESFTVSDDVLDRVATFCFF